MNNAVIVLTAAWAAALGHSTAWACGACLEDKVAATYDHAAIGAALAAHQQVVFVAIEGSVDVAMVAKRLLMAAPRIRGVQARTLHISSSPPAFSFALDAAQAPQQAVSGFRKAVGSSLAQLVLIQVMTEPVRSRPGIPARAAT